MTTMERLDRAGEESVAILDWLLEGDGSSVGTALNALQKAIACAFVMYSVDDNGVLNAEKLNVVWEVFNKNVGEYLIVYNEKHM